MAHSSSGWRVSFAHRCAQGIDTGVASDPDPGLGLAFAQKVLLAGLSGREIVLGDDIHRLAVELLGPGAVYIVGAKARLHVANGDVEVEACKGRREAGGRVAVHQHHVRLIAFQHGLDLQQNVARNIEKRLARPHNRQVVVGHHAEHVQHLVEHLTVLPGDGHHDVEFPRTCLQLVGKRAHLDGLRPRAEDEHYFLQSCFSLHPGRTSTACRRSHRRRTRCADR